MSTEATGPSAAPGRIVRCDACKEPFDAQSATFTESTGEGADQIVTVGLQCPHCGARFVAYRTNRTIRDLQDKVRKERERANAKIRAGVPPNKAERRLRQAKAELEAAMASFSGK